MDEIDRRLSVLEGARVKDRQAIVDQLSGKMANIMGAAGKSSRKRKAGSTKTSTGTASTTGYEHIVKDGETLSAIALAYNVKARAIIEANKLPNPDTLLKGQKLFIPQP